MVVTFCGHKDCLGDKALAANLRTVILNLIEEGANYFLLGGYGQFDSLAARTLRDLKTQFPYIHSTLVLPYLNREFNGDLYDDTTYPPLEKVPPRFAISRRNEWMVDHADVVVSYVIYEWGGAATTLRYAKRKKKRIISAAE